MIIMIITKKISLKELVAPTGLNSRIVPGASRKTGAGLDC